MRFCKEVGRDSSGDSFVQFGLGELEGSIDCYEKVQPAFGGAQERV